MVMPCGHLRVGIKVGHTKKLVAGLFDGVFHSLPVEQSALGLVPGERLAHRWRHVCDFRIAALRGGASIPCGAGFGRIPVLGLPGSELKDALPCQPRSHSRYQHAGEDHRACTGGHHDAEVSNLHSAYEFLNTAASIHHPSSGSGSPPRKRGCPDRHAPAACSAASISWRVGRAERDGLMRVRSYSRFRNIATLPPARRPSSRP